MSEQRLVNLKVALVGTVSILPKVVRSSKRAPYRSSLGKLKSMFQKLVLAMLVSLTVTRAMPLVDLDPSCDRLTSLGDCDESPEWMLRFCTRSCFAYYESSTEAPSDDPEENR